MPPSSPIGSTAQAGTGGDGEAAPGLHGNGIASVSLGGTTLSPGASASVREARTLRSTSGAEPGENTENDVTVT